MHLLLVLYGQKNVHFKNHEEKQRIREKLIEFISQATNIPGVEFIIRYKNDRGISDSKKIILRIPPKLKEKISSEHQEGIHGFLVSNLSESNVEIDFRETK